MWTFPNLRLRNGTDGLEPLAAGYPTATIASCTEWKQPGNYHWPNDVAANVDFGTVADGVRLSERWCGVSTSAGCRRRGPDLRVMTRLVAAPTPTAAG